MKSIHKERCTFAIVSHPDAGKTTMTEKLLWFGEDDKEYRDEAPFHPKRAIQN